MVYGEEYSDANIARMRDLYAQSQQSAFDRATAQLITAMGGRGTATGTPFLNKGGQFATQLAGNVAGYEAGLRGTGLDKAYQERTQIAPQYTGMYGGQQTMQGRSLADALAASQQQQQYFPSQFTGQLPGGGQTMQYQQWAQMSPYQQALVSQTGLQQQVQQQQAYFNMLASLASGLGLASGASGFDWGSLFGG